MSEVTSASDPLPQPADLARRVLRWLAIAGIVFGGYGVLTFVLLLLANRNPLSATYFEQFVPRSLAGVVRQVYRFVLVLSLAAPALLAAGSAGLLYGRRWARPLLLTYAFLQIAASAAAHLLVLPLSFSPVVGWTASERVFSVFSAIGGVLSASLFPAAVIACLYKPGLERYARPPSGNFPVIKPAAPPAGGMVAP